MRVTFLGAAQRVTGSATLIETGRMRILVDAGLSHDGVHHPGARPLPLNPRHLDAVVLTHAHADHTGLVPYLVQHGFRGPVYATPGTIDLCRLILPDSGHIQEEAAALARRHGRGGAVPLYTQAQAHASLRQFERLPYGKTLVIDRDVRLTLHDAGHLLGSALVEFDIEGSKLVFTGDLGRGSGPLQRPPATLERVDYLVTESTYGDREHEPASTRQEQLAALIRETDGPLLIPAFAVGRTQEVLWDLLELSGRMELPPIHLDSPMALAATELYARHAANLDPRASFAVRNGALLEIPGLKIVQDPEASRQLSRNGGRHIILSAGGMCEGGRIRHHLHRQLGNPEATVALVGFQAPGTLGRRLREGARSVRMMGQTIGVSARIASVGGYSAHADARAIVDWIGSLDEMPALTFLTHGEPHASRELGDRLGRELGLMHVAPGPMDAFDLLPVQSHSTHLHRGRRSA